MRLLKYIFLVVMAFCLLYCGSNILEYEKDSPTSGKLKVYYGEGLTLHIKNHIYTFESIYERAKVEAVVTSEEEAVKNLLDDSCTGIIINRLLNENELKVLTQKNLSQNYTALAKTGVALIVNRQSLLSKLTVQQVVELLSDKLIVKDSLGKDLEPVAVFDSKTSSVTRYLLDSLLQGKKFGSKCSAVNNSMELLSLISASDNKNTIGFIDFAWLSDKDDSLYKAYANTIKFLPIGRIDSVYFEPNQSSFKTGEYPFTRTIYYLRRSGDFTLSKGFESFMSGPKGQMLFLKQGLLPCRQQERAIEIKTVQ